MYLVIHEQVCRGAISLTDPCSCNVVLWVVRAFEVVFP